MQKETPKEMTDQPLSMSVHDLPDVQSPSGLNPSKASRWMIWLVLLVCAAPVVMSYLTYYVIRPQGKSVNGELIEPLRALPQVMASQEGSEQLVDLRSLKGQWLLVSVDSGACQAACQEKLYIQRQLLVSLGKEQDRVDWVWLVSDQEAIAPEIKPGLAKATVLRVSQKALEDWLSMSSIANASPLKDESSAPDKPNAGNPVALQELGQYFYLVDPMGQLMERFKAGSDRDSAMKIKKDLEKLLRASSSWDKAGR